MDVFRLFRQLWPYLMRYRLKLFLGLIFIVISNLIAIVNPQIVRQAIDYLKGDIQTMRLFQYAGLIVLITLVQGVFRFLMRRTVIVVSRLVEFDLRNELFARLQSLSQNFFQRTPTGDLIARMTSDLNAIRSVMGPGIMYTINTATTMILVFVMMISISRLLTLIALLPIPLLVFLVSYFSRQINKRYSAVQAQFAEISTRVQENLAGIRIIKSYVKEKSELQDFNRINREYINKSLHYVKVHAAFRPMMMLLVGLSVVLTLLIGGRLIISGTITLGQFVAFNMYLGMLVWPSIALGWVLGLFYQGVASMKRLNLIFDARPDIVDAPDVKKVTRLHGAIRFERLNFSYANGSSEVLKDIDFQVEAGQVVALIGRTGSGKSTIIKLIARIYDAPDDSILIDDIPIKKIPLKTLREHIGYVPQETFLFSDTIRNNIAFARPDASLEEIEWAARMAEVHQSIVEFPDGYDTLLGERGINLSGGQKQRLTLARALLKKPSILLLDDALSAVDNLTEERILQHLKQVMKNKTCFWVSHRISAIRHADLILVLDQGQIVERGTHESLLALGGLYADIFEKQQLEEFVTQVD
ncbi:ABC transporter related protein [Caldithrix abyssi DSM 13497]|uniref:Multidrug resistance-like ATP-binding protein MdlA n=1 Tax=Caldithrix abyssi DSM 13497 TaxID=880073 RepID=H1XWF8_CALAY|nr:ABC transporter ATP-binding protein [Caldithrix abyssi]APF20771.1 ATP-binding cassette, subfamily B [Caldithrix abyssi DSM 13497]EHO40740.1 ABC transporter related protein [Caldithrix abyssi DSM 13497]